LTAAPACRRSCTIDSLPVATASWRRVPSN